MRGSEFVFDSIDLLHYNLHKISLNRGRSYIDSPRRLKIKSASINPKNNDDTCFQYAALSYEQIKKNPQRISKTKVFIDQYNWKEIDFPSHKKDWKKVELNNKSIALNVFYVPYTKTLSALFRGVTSKHDGEFSCLNCFHSYTTKNKLEKY